MGGKRPEQQKESEANTTDYKFRTDDEHIHEQAKHLLHTPRGKLADVERGENPALKELKSRKRGKIG